jgi:hypothetical protein
MVSARRAETRWVTRIIPFILGGCVGFATFVLVKHVCCMAPRVRLPDAISLSDTG